MSREPHEIALQAWIESVLTAFNGNDEFPPGHVMRAYYSDQANARVAKPYATLLVLGDQAIGYDDKRTRYNSGNDTVTTEEISRRQGRVSVQIFGPLHGTMARYLEQSISRESVRATNKAAGLVVAYVSSAAVRLSTDTNNVVEDRTRMEFLFRFVSTAEFTTAEYINSLTVDET